MKIKFNELPDGFEVKNGEIIQVKQSGGSTGDQKDYSLVTTQTDGSIDDDIKVNYSMTSVPRDEANIEAEGGETVLTDLNGDGYFNLYDIKGPRHGSGGVPLFLPEQSFVFSDFSKMKFTKDEMAEMGIESKKKMTPAKISKKYGTNKFNALLKDPFVDNIQAKTADLMLEKNKRKLSKLSFMQEAKKDFEDGVPVTSFPFLVEQGQDPIEYTQQVEQITRQQAEQKVIQSLPPEQQMQIAAMQQYMAQVDQQQQQEQQGAQDQGMLPQSQQMQQQGMQQEMQQDMQQMPQDMSQQGMMPPPPEMDDQQLAQMGYEVEGMSYAQAGTEVDTPEKATRRLLDSREELPELFDMTQEQKDVFYAREKFLKDQYLKRGYTQEQVDEDIYFDIIYPAATWKGENYDKLISDDDIFLATGKRPKGNTPTTDQSSQTSGDYRDKIIDYELSHGSADGKGLPLDVAFKKSVTGIDFTGDEETDRELVKDWIQTIDDKYSEYPLELRKRMVDFEVNSEDPRAALMEAAGLLSPQQKLQLYTNGKLDLAKVEDIWEMAEDDVLSKISDSGFIDKFDAAKHRSYSNTRGANVTYNVTHGPRVDMFNEGFNYDNWKQGKYYKYDNDKGVFIKSNQATTKEAEEFLDDPERELETTREAEENTKEQDFPIAKEDPINKVFLGNSELLENYEALERTFKDPNSPAGRGLISRFKEALNNNDYFGPNVSKSEKEKLRNLNEQEILDYFLMMQKRNLGAYAHELKGNVKISDLAQTGDPKGEYKELYDKMGMSYNDATGFPIAAQQLSYIAYRDLLKDRDEGKLDDVQNKSLTGFGIKQVGAEDEKYKIDPENNISRSDKHGNNTTLGQHSTYTPPNVIEDAEEVEDFPAAEEVTVEGEDKDINIQPNQLKVPYNPNDPRFWLQDLLKLNAIASRKRKKFYPWQPAVEDIDVDYVLEDPTRAIAATNEQMNLMAQGLGTFGGPQSFNSRMANVQAKTAASIANVTAGVHNRNINTINRGQAQQAQYDYMVDKENRTRNTKLYDDTMKVEQNALIEQNFDREQYADAMANAYSNMANTYNMNTLYDNYNIDPTTGGMMYFTNPNALDPSPNYETSKFEQYKRMNNQIRSRYNRDMNETEMKYFLGNSDQRQLNNYQREALNNNPAGVFGYDANRTGKRGREINKLLPFFSGKIGI